MLSAVLLVLFGPWSEVSLEHELYFAAKHPLLYIDLMGAHGIYDAARARRCDVMRDYARLEVWADDGTMLVQEVHW